MRNGQEWCLLARIIHRQDAKGAKMSAKWIGLKDLSVNPMLNG